MAAKLYLTSKIKELREANGWSRKEFADLLSVQLKSDVNESTVNMWERGERAIAPTLALEISRLYKIDLKELVERK
jgi:transcriptional regulator with XRE-family HTH domain